MQLDTLQDLHECLASIGASTLSFEEALRLAELSYPDRNHIEAAWLARWNYFGCDGPEDYLAITFNYLKPEEEYLRPLLIEAIKQNEMLSQFLSETSWQNAKTTA